MCASCPAFHLTGNAISLSRLYPQRSLYFILFCFVLKNFGACLEINLSASLDGLLKLECMPSEDELQLTVTDGLNLLCISFAAS